jgi:hypothetical protein
MICPLNARTYVAYFLLSLGAIAQGPPAPAEPGDVGWPRVFKMGDRQLTIHQPQVDFWTGYTNLQFRCAIGIKGIGRDEKFGVAEVEAQTVTDHDLRTVAVYGVRRTLRFANVSDREQLRATVEQLYPVGQVTVLALERVLAYLEPPKGSTQGAVEVNLHPPKIFSSSRPAILVYFMGKPQFRPVETNRSDLEFALNTNWDILYDTHQQRFYLLNGESWLTTADLLNGPWSAVNSLPSSFHSLPDDHNWSEVRKNVPGKLLTRVPNVFVTTKPAELILVEGPPRYTRVPGTDLQRVSNTKSVLFLSANRTLYFLVAGRWFRADGLSGPWTPASENLPADFARIPHEDPSAFVRASVPGTAEAKDAVLLASIPKVTTAMITNVNLEVVYSGEPKFHTIENTGVQYAVNTPSAVFLVDGIYYCCLEGCFLTSSSATGPWTVSRSVPPAIYMIPSSHPMHYVTYVAVQNGTPEYVNYIQTAGYRGEYVAPTGVLMFGAGASPGDEHTEDSDAGYYYYWYTYPAYYTYGIGATYHYGYGGYYGASYRHYGPYGGAGVFAGYNPYTGTYLRSVGAYGRYGTASGTAAYNPNSGTVAARAEVFTANRSAVRAAAYNPMTGEGAIGAKHSSQYGTAAAVKTTQGSAAAWNTSRGQGVAAKAASGNVYAAKDGTLYHKDANGNWWHNSGNGWQNSLKPQPVANPALNRQAQDHATQQQSETKIAAQRQQAARQEMERQARARQAANRQTARANQYRAYGRGSGGAVVIGGRR